MPVYESSCTILTVVCGLVLFDESAFYAWSRLIEIFFCIFLVCVGILIISIKENFKKENYLPQKSED